MSRILVCGLCPLPFENTRQNYGPGIRTWQFAQSLAAEGHTVLLPAMAMKSVYGPGEMVDRESVEGIEVRRLPIGKFLEPRIMRRLVTAFEPQILFGATVYGSLALAQCQPQLPFWADQFGHLMAEAQAKAALEGSDWPLAQFWRMVTCVNAFLDKLSVVSGPQRFAAIGELGATGRLNQATAGYEFVEVIPCAAGAPANPRAAPVIRGVQVPEDGFVVLWSGGYNVWSDVDTLFRGLELAMQRHPRIHFVSTGGAIAGHDSKTYERFVEMVATSHHQERFHLQGWVMAENIPSFVSEANLGVVAEKPIYEGMLGSKNRILQWMSAGLPAVSNRVGELGELIADEAFGLSFATGDAEQLCERIIWAAQHPADLRQIGDRARHMALQRFSLKATTESLRAWAANPGFAPDRHGGGRIPGPTQTEDLLRKSMRYLKKLPGSARWRSFWQ